MTANIKPQPPKKSKTGYLYFSTDPDNRKKHAEKSNGNIKTLLKLLGNEWKTMSDEEKQPYFDMAAQDHFRYKIEKYNYDNGIYDYTHTGVAYRGVEYLIDKEFNVYSSNDTNKIIGKIIAGKITLDEEVKNTEPSIKEELEDSDGWEWSLYAHKGKEYFIEEDKVYSVIYGADEPHDLMVGNIVGKFINGKIILDKQKEEPVYDTLEHVKENTIEPIYDTLEPIEEEEPIYDDVPVSHPPQYPIYDNNHYAVAEPIYDTPEFVETDVDSSDEEKSSIIYDYDTKTLHYPDGHKVVLGSSQTQEVDSSDDETVYGFIETDRDIIENLNKTNMDLRTRLDTAQRCIFELEDELEEEIDVSDRLVVENRKLKDSEQHLCNLVDELDNEIYNVEYDLFKELCFGDRLLAELDCADDVNSRISQYFLESVDFNFRLTSKLVDTKNKLNVERDAYTKLYKQFIAREEELMKENDRLKRSNELLKQTGLKKAIKEGRKEHKITNEYEQL